MTFFAALLFIAIAHGLVDCLPPPLTVEVGADILPLVEPLLLALELVVAMQAIAFQVTACVALSTAHLTNSL